MQKATFEYEGHTFEYDKDLIKKYSFVSKLVRAEKNPVLFFEAADMLFMGNADAYVDTIGGTIEDAAALVEACLEDAGSKK